MLKFIHAKKKQNTVQKIDICQEIFETIKIKQFLYSLANSTQSFGSNI